MSGDITSRGELTSRRDFIVTGAAAAGGFLIGTKLSFAGSLLEAARSPAGSAAPENWVTTWVGLASDGGVILRFAKAEMGQGVLTTLSAVVGEELGVDPKDVRIEIAPIDKAHGNPKMGGEEVTGGSTTIASSFDPLRTASAQARDMLIQVGAKALHAKAANCRTENGRVVDSQSGRSAAFGQLVAAAAKLKPPSSPKFKEPAQYRYLGKPVSRRDLQAKVTGQAKYGMDIQSTPSGAPKLCVIVRCPVRGGKLKNPSGYKVSDGLVPLKNGVAAIGATTWEAIQKARALQPEWDLSGVTKADSESIRNQYLTASQSEGELVSIEPVTALVGGVPEGSIRATYELPYLPHATMEPMNCTADVRKDGCDLWVPTQVPGAAREIASAITGIAVDKIRLNFGYDPLYIGGGFGRRCYLDYVAEAVVVSKALGQPVKVVWTREDDFQNDYYRPAMTHALSGSVSGDGMISSWRQHVVGQSMLRYSADTLADGLPVDLPGWGAKLISGALKGFFHAGPLALADPTTFDGLLMESGDIDLKNLPFKRHIPYRMDRFEVRNSVIDPKVPVGFWRSVGHSHTAFAIESFIDELAHSVGRDPYEFRLSLLPADDKKVARNRRVLMLAAAQAGWDAPAANGIFRGIAQHECFDTYTAHAIEITRAGKGFRLHRVVSAIDCGFVLDPDIVTAQVEGAVIFGLTAATKQEITFSEGIAQQANFNDSDLLRINECPAIEVHFAGGSDAPTGIGEAAVPAVAPALAGALFAAGVPRERLRKLPFKI